MERTKTKTWKAVLAAAAAALVLAACMSEPAGDKAGGDAAPLTLRLGTPDQQGFPASDDLEHFASTVNRLSNGQIQVDIVWEAQGPGVSRFDQRVAEMISDGELDMGLVPARAWDELGVTTLQALQAPFLIDSEALMNDVVTSDLVDKMLLGLRAADVEGLALLPETLRHPVGFERPFLSLADFAGAKIRAPFSNATFELLRALGAEPVDLAGEAFTRAVRTGDVAGAESSLPLASRLPAAGTFTANITFFPKVNALVIGREAFERLDPSQRSIVRDAAAQTLDYVLETNVSAAEEVAQACTAGIAVTIAREEEVSTLEEAAQPVYARLEQDAQTRDLIDGIQEMKNQLHAAAAPPQTCSLEPQGPDTEPTDDLSVLNGTYRTTLTVEELETAGADHAAAVSNSGLWTITLVDGRYSDFAGCEASYSISGHTFSLTWDQFTDCTGDFSAMWSLRDGKLRFTNVAATAAVDRAIWGLHPWIKIA
jgi:TRAP-type C4-dicarboxylate transport system substrate-binding protein